MNAAKLAILLAKPSRPPAEILGQFAAGEQGGIWLPYFIKSMFQDAAATIPAAVGSPVVKILDLSGRGNHATLTDVTLQQDSAGLRYLACNGSTSSGATSSITFGTDKMTIVAGARKESDAAQGSLVHLSGADICEVGFPRSGSSTGPYVSVGASEKRGSNVAAPVTYVLAGQMDRAGATVAEQAILRVNGVVSGTDSGSVSASGNFAARTVYLFRRGGTTLPFNGRFYGAIVRGAASSASQLADAERYMGRLTGVNF